MSSDSAISQMYCPKCGRTISSDAVFCQHCAHRLSNAVEARVRSNSNKQAILMFLGGLGIVLVLIAAGVAVYQYRLKARSASSQNQVMGDQARLIENKILSGGLLTASDLDGLTSYELRVLRNVHFARYGRNYDNPDLGSYFNSRPWYRPNPEYRDSMVNSTDKANINLILSAENRAKASEAISAIIPTSTSNGALTADRVQRAVDQVLEPFKVEGMIVVQGIQELSQQNSAMADLSFNGFQFKARKLGAVVKKEEKITRQPNLKSPNWIDESIEFSSNPVELYSFTGQGSAKLDKYNDGRWVLRAIRFGGKGVATNVIIQ